MGNGRAHALPFATNHPKHRGLPLVVTHPAQPSRQVHGNGNFHRSHGAAVAGHADLGHQRARGVYTVVIDPRLGGGDGVGKPLHIIDAAHEALGLLWHVRQLAHPFLKLAGALLGVGVGRRVGRGQGRRLPLGLRSNRLGNNGGRSRPSRRIGRDGFIARGVHLGRAPSWSRRY